jgi:hypothetical protein
MKTDEYRFVYQHFRFPASQCDDIVTDALWVWGRHGRGLHFRRGEHSGWTPSPRGGYTICRIYTNDNELLAAGLAECSPRDSFCYKLGRDISRGRALKALKRVLEANG